MVPSAKIELRPAERAWLVAKWKKIRDSQTEADKADVTWKRISAEINEYLDSSGIVDIVQRTKIKRESLPLKDAYDVGNWHSRNAERHIHDVNLFLRLRELGVQ